MHKMKSKSLILAGLVIVLLGRCAPVGACHGLGAGVGRRRPGRTMVPLVQRQHIPNMSEGTIGASGPAEGRITRGDERFSKLALNYNPQVVFKDEEGTDADHRMSKRCKDRVDTLALLVANQWPGVRLRVTEAWGEEDDHHARGSLHYEGRAVDLTTDDVDHAKYGMLARLAVEAGFDWVYYESKYHIHASVVADDSATASYGGCFPSGSTVRTEDGPSKRMQDLQIGDSVMVVDRDTGETKFSDVIMFMHSDVNATGAFVDVSISLGGEAEAKKITLTPNHLLFVHRETQRKEWQKNLIFAGDIILGDKLYVRKDTEGNKTEFTIGTVTAIAAVTRRGFLAPLTYEGTIVVNDVAASCYAVFHSESISHALFWPVRTLWTLASEHAFSRLYGGRDAGVQWYPRSIFDLASLFLPRDFLRTA